MLNATAEELKDQAEYLRELAARLEIAAAYHPQCPPNLAALRAQMRTTGAALQNAAGSPCGLPVLTAEEVIDELYFPPEPNHVMEETHASSQS